MSPTENKHIREVARLKAELLALRSTLYTDYIEAETHNEIVRDLMSRSERMRDDRDELRHAIDHALDCDQGTVLCKDCTRLLRTALGRGRPPPT